MVTPADGAAPDSPAPASPAPASTAPASTAPASTGRESEIGELRGLAAGSRMVTLCGAAGIGKSRLLRELMPALAGDRPDGTFLVELGDLRQPGLVAARVAASLGVCEEPGVPLAVTVAEALAQRRLLLALDAPEQVAPACAALCQELLARSPGLLIAAASRLPLGVPGEAAWQVPPLGLPAAGEGDPARAARSAAAALFTERAAATVPGFELDAGNCAAVVAACRAVGGIPLAVELAAARVRELGASRVAADLATWPGLAGTGEHAVSHAELMTAVIGWSYGLLDPPGRLLLRRLSMPATWMLELAEQVCADDGLPAVRIRPLLGELMDAGLVERERGARTPAPGRGRYRLPGAVAEFAACRLTEAGERERLGRRLRDNAAQRAEYLVSIAAARVPVTWSALRQLFHDSDADTRNFRAALAWCQEHGETEAGLRICSQLRIFWTAVGAVAEGSDWFDAFLDSDLAGVQPVVLGAALAAGAQLAFSLGDVRRAESWGAAALELCRAAGEPHATAGALNVLARAALVGGRPEEALALTAETAELTHNAGDWWNEAFALSHRAQALAAAGRLDEGRKCAEAALALTLETDQHWGTALARLGLGDLAQKAGDLDAARDYYLAALPFARQAMPKPEIAGYLTRLGRIALRQDDPVQAREYFAESLQLSLAAGSRRLISDGLLALARLSVREGRPDRAVQLAAACTALCETARLPVPPQALRYRDAPAGLEPEQAERLWAAGLELTTRAAAALALEPPAGRGAV
jgi:predicted ATPase